MVTIKDFYDFWTDGYMTQLFTPPVLPEGFDLRELYRGEAGDRITYPVIFRQRRGYGGKKIVDFLNTGWSSIGPVSDRVIELLEANGVTGWQTYPIEVYLKDGTRLEGYQGFSITGRCSCSDLSVSVEEEREYEDRNGERHVETIHRGVPLSLADWDGSDIFMYAGTTWAFMSKRVYKLFKSNKVTNLHYVNAGERIFDRWNPIEDILRPKPQ